MQLLTVAAGAIIQRTRENQRSLAHTRQAFQLLDEGQRAIRVSLQTSRGSHVLP